MSVPFYERCGSLISPGDILDRLPPVKLPTPIRVARRSPYNPPAKFRARGELHQVLEVGKDIGPEETNFSGSGEQVVLSTKASRVIFLTWGSEVEDDERSGKVDKKDWLVAPVTKITTELQNQKIVGTDDTMADAIRGNKSARFFHLPGTPSDDNEDYYVDLRRICPVAAGHVREIARHWRLSSPALNDFYHQLIWFFTRKRVFFEPLECGSCGASLDLNIVFEGQPVDPEQ